MSQKKKHEKTTIKIIYGWWWFQWYACDIKWGYFYRNRNSFGLFVVISALIELNELDLGVYMLDIIELVALVFCCLFEHMTVRTCSADTVFITNSNPISATLNCQIEMLASFLAIRSVTVKLHNIKYSRLKTVWLLVCFNANRMCKCMVEWNFNLNWIDPDVQKGWWTINKRTSVSVCSFYAFGHMEEKYCAEQQQKTNNLIATATAEKKGERKWQVRRPMHVDSRTSQQRLPFRFDDIWSVRACVTTLDRIILIHSTHRRGCTVYTYTYTHMHEYVFNKGNNCLTNRLLFSIRYHRMNTK